MKTCWVDSTKKDFCYLKLHVGIVITTLNTAFDFSYLSLSNSLTTKIMCALGFWKEWMEDHTFWLSNPGNFQKTGINFIEHQHLYEAIQSDFNTEVFIIFSIRSGGRDIQPVWNDSFSSWKYLSPFSVFRFVLAEDSSSELHQVLLKLSEVEEAGN